MTSTFRTFRVLGSISFIVMSLPVVIPAVFILRLFKKLGFLNSNNFEQAINDGNWNKKQDECDLLTQSVDSTPCNSPRVESKKNTGNQCSLNYSDIESQNTASVKIKNIDESSLKSRFLKLQSTTKIANNDLQENYKDEKSTIAKEPDDNKDYHSINGDNHNITVKIATKPFDLAVNGSSNKEQNDTGCIPLVQAASITANVFPSLDHFDLYKGGNGASKIHAYENTKEQNQGSLFRASNTNQSNFFHDKNYLNHPDLKNNADTISLGAY